MTNIIANQMILDQNLGQRFLINDVTVRETVIYREGLISVITEKQGNRWSHFTNDREIKRFKGIILTSEQTAGIPSVFVGRTT